MPGLVCRVNVVSMSLSQSSYRWSELPQHKQHCRDSRFQSWQRNSDWRDIEKSKQKNSSLKVELHSDPIPFPVDWLWVLSWVYQQPAARGAEGCSRNSALFTKLGIACLTTSRCFNFLPFGEQFEEHLSISPFLLLASWIHEGWRLIVLIRYFLSLKMWSCLGFLLEYRQWFSQAGTE